MLRVEGTQWCEGVYYQQNFYEVLASEVFTSFQIERAEVLNERGIECT